MRRGDRDRHPRERARVPGRQDQGPLDRQRVRRRRVRRDDHLRESGDGRAVSPGCRPRAESDDQRAVDSAGGPSTAVARDLTRRPRQDASRLAELVEEHERRARHAGDPGRRQADRSSRGDDVLQTSRACSATSRAGRNKIQGHAIPVSARELPHLHPARAGRSVRRDHPLELPAGDGVVEARPGPRVRQRDDHQAGRADAVDDAAARRAGARGRRAGGRRERPAGYGEIGGAPRRARGGGQGGVHRSST